MSGFPLPPFGGHPAFPGHWLPDQTSAPSADSTYQPFGLGHFPMPPPPMYPTNGANLAANTQIPGLSPFAHAMPPTPQDFPMPNSNSTSYYSPSTHVQTSAPSSYPTFPPQMYHYSSNGTTSKHPIFSEMATGETMMSGADQAIPTDAMDLDSREEGELSNGEMEMDVINSEGQQHPHSVQEQPPAESQQSTDDNNDRPWSKDNIALATSQQQPLIAQTKPTHNGLSSHDSASLKDPLAVYDGQSANGSQPPAQNGRSLTQLRMQAQGALLNLAPHNIRYKELVSEGVDPIILKTLYEGIGLKVAAVPAVHTPATNVGSQNHPGPPTSRGQNAGTHVMSTVPSAPPSGLVQDQAIGAHNLPQEKCKSVIKPLAGSEAAASKPLERKDLIARMLAAKAGKSASTQQEKPAASSVQKALDSSKENIAPLTSATSHVEQLQTSEETRAREKNKAQTELARQRMEQLRKKGLSKPQSQSASDSSSSPLTVASTSINVMHSTTPQDSRALQSMSMKHPLPERPPDTDVIATRIPGLFMTGSEQPGPDTPSTPINRQAASFEPSSSTVRIPCKRPRASDFTDDVEEPSHKQPGQNTRISNSDHKVIIDISEDESMYDVNVGSTANEQPGERKDAANSPRPKPLTNRDMPFFDTSARPTHSYRSASSGSLPQASGKGRDEENIRSEIMAMRQRIAELEKRRDAKRAAQAQTNNTPPQSALSSAAATPKISHGERQLLASNLPQPSLQDTQNTFSTPNIAVAPIIATVGTSTIVDENSRSPSSRSWSSLEPRKAEELRQKFLRKKEIETGLPALEAELVRSEARLAQFREEEKRLLAEIAKGKAGRQRLIAELEELGVETEGLTLEELQLTKDRLEAEAEMKEQTPEPAQDVPVAAKPTAVPESASQVVNIPESRPSPRSTQVDNAPDIPTVPRTSQEAIDAAAQATNTQQMVIRDREGSILSSCSSSAMDESMGSSADDEEAVDEDTNQPTHSAHEGKGPASVDQSTRPVQKDTQSSIDISMGETSVLSHKEIDKDVVSSQEQSDISEVYEPPEPDTANHSDSAVASRLSFGERSPKPPSTNLQHAPLDQKVETLTLTDQGSPVAIPTANLKVNAENNSHFTPYKSPLRLFKAYRYHPNFVNDVEGGFRSITYSHNIDPMNTLCAFEGSGGTCNDKSCRSQHFRDMILSDDKILVEMGSLREGKTPAEREEYVTGLKQIINDMRRDKVKDFNTVATEIAAYRRRFLKDPSRVLAL